MQLFESVPAESRTGWWGNGEDRLAPVLRLNARALHHDPAELGYGEQERELNDFSVCTTWGVFDDRYYLLDVLRRRMNYPELKRAVCELANRYNPNAILIEDKASGTQLIQDLKDDGVFSVQGYDPPPGTDKTLRLHAQTAQIENGRLVLPRSAPWLAEYVRELTSFPGGKFDDQVDSTTQALDHLHNNDSLSVWARL